ncbi:MAG: AAA family ATPase [Dehalococcoidales bacterium]|nr:AAA family ATPase [Dehalococcoidales bacterium]
MPNIDPAYIKKLDDKAFQLLPHEYVYDAQRQITGLVLWDEDQGWTYEQFKWELDLHLDNEDEKAILKLGRELERLDKLIDLVVDISEFPEPDWIVEGIVVRNGLTLLYGDSGAGKTTFCLYLVDAVQHGKDLFGLKCKIGNPMFIENDESPELLKSLRDIVGLPKILPVAKAQIVWDTNNKNFNKEFSDILYYYKPDVVIIDAYTSLGIPDITRPESGLVLDEMRRLARKYECAFVIIHHVNKSGEQIGSSLHKAKMDSMVSLTNDNNIVTLIQEKVRGTKFGEKLINFDPITLKMTDAKMTIKQRVKLLKAQGLTLKDIQSMLSYKKDTIRKAFNSP